MEPSTPSLGVLDGKAAAEQRVDGVASEVPAPLKSLSLAEQRVWDYVAVALKDYGLIHRTDAMLMHLIVSTFVQWVDAEAVVEKHIAENKGSFMVKTPNGYEQPHQCYYMARNLKTELLRMLPEACLTIPSFAKVKQAMREPQQPDMFDPLVAFVSGKPQPPKLVHSRMTNADLDWDAYGRDVLAGKIVVCKWVRKAVERHYRDLETGAARGLIFSEAHARHVLAFFDFLKHSKDKWAGTRFELSRWQAFWLAVLFGWLRADGTRRFRKAYWEIARKNGKSTLLSGVGLYLLIGDGIAGAEVYTAATKLDQAKIVHEEAKRMVLQSAELRKHLQIVKNDILLPGTANTYKPLGADALTQDGLNPHGAILDELHAHPSRALWDVIESATGSRSQPLMFAITTAGFNIENSICIEQRNYVRRILEEAIDDDAYFGVIYTLDGYDGGEDDEKDDWTDPKHWIKANPNLGLSVFQDNLAESVRVAQNEPSAQANVLTKRFNVWVKASHLWMAMDRWKACGRAYTLEDLQDIVAVYGGLDLASTSDLCSLGLQFILDDGSRALWGKHYLPEDVALDSENPNHRLYMMWKEQGWLTITPGNVTDYAFIKSDAAKLLERFPIEEIAFDRWNSSQLVTDLMNDGANMVAFGQGYASMSPAMKEFERLIKGKQLIHPNDPVMTWAMSNVVASKDPAGNIKPDKQKSANKIDPAVAQIMAAGRASLAKIEPVIKTAFVGL